VADNCKIKQISQRWVGDKPVFEGSKQMTFTQAKCEEMLSLLDHQLDRTSCPKMIKARVYAECSRLQAEGYVDCVAFAKAMQTVGFRYCYKIGERVHAKCANRVAVIVAFDGGLPVIEITEGQREKTWFSYIAPY
jgi:hypothetical protein